ncbi:Mbeg1-like protein [Streptococcus oralis]|jgi:hypothetical protein|uniref:Lipase (Class 3) n=1 Tax=Streptococcus oralis subsp. dentisani TaxID=1458253 RepID=A0A3R9SE60_STROR|nr:Mbeg1-like protein [Streptococcus oralis]MBF1111869.1 DUF2974 domain-containing protein [Streptococcus sp.]MBZ2084666.1 DUF2974 domain-containing protein [Streptococcus oralis]MBZ2088557.1 DUF2974 domain-containing protein [Streptococcus oralis]MBZ2096345.1 DUF2974 domain-containing protein [Streptococcus oralis]MBZ2101853.1 DUF2974 domain-containing protein [Streptococcus oralis]
MTQNYIKENNLQTAMAEYQDNMGEERTLYDQYERELGTVTQVYNNTTGAGEQVYAVVKNPNEKADKVQEVTVLFRGSTGPDHFWEETADFWNDWAENDAVIAKRIMLQKDPSYQDKSTEQLKASARALKDIMEKYPNAKINVYGHSLGSMDAQYSMAALQADQVKRIQQAYIYNGPDIYRILSPEQRKVVDSIKTRIHNYADPDDPISMVGRDMVKGSIGSVGLVYYVDSTKEDFVNQHMTYGYQLDKNGKIKILSNTSTVIYNDYLLQMDNYTLLKEKLSEGGYTKEEQLFLDSEQAGIAAASISLMSTEGKSIIKSIRDEAVEDARKVFASRRQVPWGFILSPSEMENAYIEGGATYETTIGVIEKLLDPVVDKISQLEKDCIDLETQTKKGIQKKLETDKELAEKFRQWKKLT